jgi:hypothetical protein
VRERELSEGESVCEREREEKAEDREQRRSYTLTIITMMSTTTVTTFALPSWKYNAKLTMCNTKIATSTINACINYINELKLTVKLKLKLKSKLTINKKKYIKIKNNYNKIIIMNNNK